MQIFVVENHPKQIAHALCNKHIVSQVGETAEMLAIAHVRNGEYVPPLITLEARRRHINHPCCAWVSQTEGNYIWAHQLALALCQEFKHRYGHEHAYEKDIMRMLHPPFKLMQAAMPQTPAPAVVPEQYKAASVIQSYRNYYHYKAARMAMHWTNRRPPHWFLLGEEAA